MVWPHLKIVWHGEDDSAVDSERRKEGKEDRRREGKITSRNGQNWSLENTRPQRKTGKG